MRFRLLLVTALFAALSVTSCSRQSGSSEIRTFPMGERVQMGRFVYTVFETQWLTQLGDGPTARIPQHRFFLVRLSITNTGGSPAIVPTLSLVSDGGETFPELGNGEAVPQWIGFLRQIKPAETTQGNVVFDVPPKHYKLRVADENEQHIGLIDIPLSFGGETPELPAPEPAIPEAGKK